MTTIQGTVLDVTGQPVPHANIHVALVTSSAATPGYTSGGDVIATKEFNAAQDGTWSTTLLANSVITPANTYYVVTEGRASQSPILVPATGGPYTLAELLVTDPPTPAAPGITGVQVAANATVAGVRPQINFQAGSGVTLTASDDGANNRVDLLISSAGAVSSVNTKTGAVTLGASDVGADAAGSAAAAQAAAETFATGAVATETSRAEAAEATKLTASQNLADLQSEAAARTNLGLGTAATANTTAFDAAGAAASAQSAAEAFATGAVNTETTRAEAAEATKLTASSNLADLTNAATARASLGLGDAAVASIETTGSVFQPIGAAAPGATGEVADAGHTHPYPPWVFYVATYGAKGDGVTDDTAAINRAVAAGFAYAQANHGFFVVLFDPVTYLLSSPPTTGGATLGSAQIPIPIQPQTAEKITVVFQGTRDQTGLYHWLQVTPQRAGTVLRSTYNAGDTLPATGEASVIGGPTPHYMGDPPSSWNNVLVCIDGISIELDAPGNMCGLDFRDCAEANIINAGVLALSSQTGAPAIPPANWAFGCAMPVTNNNDNCNIGWYSVEGMVYGLIAYEHLEAASVRIINCFDGLTVWSSSGFPHRNHVAYASIEGCQRCIVFAGGFNKLNIDVCDIEWGGGFIIDDVGTAPSIGQIGICSNGASGASLSAALSTSPTNVNVANGPLALEIINLDQDLGPVTPPALPGSGTALQNPFWRHASVTIAGGTVTEVAIDGVNQLLTAGTFHVPSGHTITLTYSAAPSWAWTLVG